jgi:hypothetical protein
MAVPGMEPAALSAMRNRPRGLRNRIEAIASSGRSSKGDIHRPPSCEILRQPLDVARWVVASGRPQEASTGQPQGGPR